MDNICLYAIYSFSDKNTALPKTYAGQIDEVYMQWKGVGSSISFFFFKVGADILFHL